MYTYKSSVSVKKCLEGCIKFDMWTDASCFTTLQDFNDITWGMLPHLLNKNKKKGKKTNNLWPPACTLEFFPMLIYAYQGRGTQGFPDVLEKLLSNFTRLLKITQPPVLPLHSLKAAGGCRGRVLLLLANLAKSTTGISCIPVFLTGWQKATSWIPRGLSVHSVNREHGQKITELPKLRTNTP